MRRCTFSVGLIALSGLILVYSFSSRAAEWPLVTDEEFRLERAAPHIAESFALPPQGAPIIEVEQPDQSKPIRSPVSIRILFRAQGGAVIDRSSLRIYYGWLRIDITQKVLEHAQLTDSGLTAADARLPSGHHRVALQIADNKRRASMQIFEFTVE